MLIKQSVVKKNWLIDIDFEGYTFPDGEGPFYLSGDFNNWKKEDKKYKVSTPKKKGSKAFSSIKLKIPATVKNVEFKIFNKAYQTWMEPISGDSLYKDSQMLVSNPFGTLNVRVEQNI